MHQEDSILQPVEIKFTWIENVMEFQKFLQTELIIMKTKIKIKVTMRGILQRTKGDYKRD